MTTPWTWSACTSWGGTIGALLTGIFATRLVNPAIALEGGTALMLRQVAAILATYAFCGVGTYVLLVVVNAITTLRARQDEEIVGMDLSQHTERAYLLGGGETVVSMREPRLATAPPPVTGGRFTVTLSGIDVGAMTEHWRQLCQESNGTPSAEFKNVYARVSTIRGSSFRFRGGDRELVRRSLEQLFKPVTAGVKATIED